MLACVLECFLPPKSGDKTQGLLKEKTDEGQEYLQRRSSELGDSATYIIQSGKESIGHQKDTPAAAVAVSK
jgi:hypothetical protein